MKTPFIKTDSGGFSLIEMLVSIVVASIMMLTIGVLSTIANSSFNKLIRIQKLYDDISIGLKYAQNRVRASDSILITSLGNPWVGEQIQVTGTINGLSQTQTLGLCLDNGQTNLVNRPTPATTCADSDIILSASAADSLSLALSWPCDCNNDAIQECVGNCVDDCNFSLIGTTCDCTDKVTLAVEDDSGTCTNPPEMINTRLSGVKNKIPFTVETTIFRRNS